MIVTASARLARPFSPPNLARRVVWACSPRLAKDVTVIYRVAVAVSILLLVMVEVIKFVDVTRTVSVLVVYTVVVEVCPICVVHATVTVSGSVDGV